ncbi:MAG: Bacterial regulatory protein luxR family [Pseudomonadota bacterium]|jgi:DNA-binding CsgD family transcriptional regulator
MNLSPRETQTLRLVAAGHTLNSAGLEMGITVHTVKDNTRTVRFKLGARTNAQAVAIAAQRGLL